MVPSAKKSAISDSKVTTLLNQGCDEVNLLIQIYKGYTEFTSEADTGIYSLASNVPNYLGMSKNGVWWTTASSTLQRLFPKTMKWLDKRKENWRDGASGEPQYYWQEGDDLGFDPTPSAARTVRVYHLMKATPMTTSTKYPFTNGDSEVTAFRPLDDAIVAYARWKVANMLGKDKLGVLTEQEFIEITKRKARQVRRRPDITSGDAGRMLPRL